MNTRFFLCCLLFVSFWQTAFGQCTGIPCVVLIDGKIPGDQYISEAYFEYQDSVKGAVKIPIKDISPCLIEMADTNLRKLEQLVAENIYFQIITLNFDFVEIANEYSYQVKYNLHYSCSFRLNHLMTMGSNVITFYNIDKEKGTYLYYYYLDGALGFSKNTTPYVEEKHRAFYNYY